MDVISGDLITLDGLKAQEWDERERQEREIAMRRALAKLHQMNSDDEEEPASTCGSDGTCSFLSLSSEDDIEDGADEDVSETEMTGDMTADTYCKPAPSLSEPTQHVVSSSSAADGNCNSNSAVQTSVALSNDENLRGGVSPTFASTSVQMYEDSVSLFSSSPRDGHTPLSSSRWDAALTSPPSETKPMEVSHFSSGKKNLLSSFDGKVGGQTTSDMVPITMKRTEEDNVSDTNSRDSNQENKNAPPISNTSSMKKDDPPKEENFLTTKHHNTSLETNASYQPLHLKNNSGSSDPLQSILSKWNLSDCANRQHPSSDPRSKPLHQQDQKSESCESDSNQLISFSTSIDSDYPSILLHSPVKSIPPDQAQASSVQGIQSVVSLYNRNELVENLPTRALEMHLKHVTAQNNNLQNEIRKDRDKLEAIATSESEAREELILLRAYVDQFLQHQYSSHNGSQRDPVPTLSELRGSALQESKSQLAASNDECKRLQTALDDAVASASNLQATQEAGNPALREELQKLTRTLETRVAIDSDEARENKAREEASKRTEAYLIRKAANAEATATQLREKVNALEAEIELFQNVDKADQDGFLEPIGELCNERISEQMSSLQTELKRVTRERDSALENIRVIAAEKRQYETNFTQMENQLSELDELVAILEKERDDLARVDDELNRLKIGNSKLLNHKIKHGAIIDYPSQQIHDPMPKADHPEKILRGLEDMVQSLTQEKRSLLHVRDNLENQLQEAKNGMDNLQLEHTSLVHSKAESDLEISRLKDVCASLTQKAADSDATLETMTSNSAAMDKKYELILEELKETSDQFDELVTMNLKLEHRAKAAEKFAKDARANLDSSKNTNRSMKKKLDFVSAQLTSVKAKLKEATENLEEEQIAKLSDSFVRSVGVQSDPEDKQLFKPMVEIGSFALKSTLEEKNEEVSLKTMMEAFESNIDAEFAEVLKSMPEGNTSLIFPHDDAEAHNLSAGLADVVQEGLERLFDDMYNKLGAHPEREAGSRSISVGEDFVFPKKSDPPLFDVIRKGDPPPTPCPRTIFTSDMGTQTDCPDEDKIKETKLDKQNAANKSLEESNLTVENYPEDDQISKRLHHLSDSQERENEMDDRLSRLVESREKASLTYKHRKEIARLITENESVIRRKVIAFRKEKERILEDVKEKLVSNREDLQERLEEHVRVNFDQSTKLMQLRHSEEIKKMREDMFANFGKMDTTDGESLKGEMDVVKAKHDAERKGLREQYMDRIRCLRKGWEEGKLAVLKCFDEACSNSVNFNDIIVHRLNRPVSMKRPSLINRETTENIFQDRTNVNSPNPSQESDLKTPIKSIVFGVDEIYGDITNTNEITGQADMDRAHVSTSFISPGKVLQAPFRETEALVLDVLNNCGKASTHHYE
eukprot:scaffold421301_cov52-Attheya_sp.AAC.14